MLGDHFLISFFLSEHTDKEELQGALIPLESSWNRLALGLKGHTAFI